MKNRKILMYLLYVSIVYCLLASSIIIYYGNPKFKEQDYIKTENGYIQVKNSYKTKLNDYNQIISKKQTFFIIIVDTNIDKNLLTLKYNNKNYYNNNEYEDLFQDISGNKLVYILDDNNINEEFYLFYQGNEKMLKRNYRIKLNPINLDIINDPIIYYLKDSIIFKNNENAIIDFDIKKTIKMYGFMLIILKVIF